MKWAFRKWRISAAVTHVTPSWIWTYHARASTSVMGTAVTSVTHVLRQGRFFAPSMKLDFGLKAPYFGLTT